LHDDEADPVALRLLRSAKADGPSPQQLLAAPSAIAALVATQCATISAAAAVAGQSLTAATTQAATASNVALGAKAVALPVATSLGAATSATAGGFGSSTLIAPMLPALVKATVVGVLLGGSLVVSVPAMRSVGQNVVGAAPSTRPQGALAARGSKPRAGALTTRGDERALSLAHEVSGPQRVGGSTLGEPARAASAPLAKRLDGSALAAGVTSQATVSALPACGRGAEPRVRAAVASTSNHASRVAVAPLDADASQSDRQQQEFARPERRDVALKRADSAESIPNEVHLIDDARQWLESGHAELALTKLDEYAGLTHRTLEPEAVVLRVRGLLALGRRQDAESTASAFRTRFPHAPQNRILDHVLGRVPVADPK
jgi:hypothetical protein